MQMCKLMCKYADSQMCKYAGVRIWGINVEVQNAMEMITMSKQ